MKHHCEDPKCEFYGRCNLSENPIGIETLPFGNGNWSISGCNLSENPIGIETALMKGKAAVFAGCNLSENPIGIETHSRNVFIPIMIRLQSIRKPNRD